MAFGLSAIEESFLNENLIQPLKKLGCQVYLFGSRATGKYKKFSDIDILYKPSEKILNHQIFEILEKIENSSFVYKIDLVAYDDLAESYKSKIEKELIEI